MAAHTLRPPMPRDEYHRSVPTSPFDMDPRDPRIMGAPFDSCRTGMDGPDYFGAIGAGSFANGPLPQKVPLPPALEPEMVMGYSQQHIDDLVRRTNLLVQFVNGQIAWAAKYGQLQPKMCADGRFPPDFRSGRTVEEIRVTDPTTLDRILRSYGLPTDLRSLQLTSRDSVSTRTALDAKLCTLFDFLGASQISERQRRKRVAALLPY